MATYEKDGLMTVIDPAGDKYLLYPITKIDCVDGVPGLAEGSDGQVLGLKGGALEWLDKAKKYTYTLTPATWTGPAGSYTQSTSLPGVTADNILHWGGVADADKRAISQCRVDLAADAGSLTWSAKALPTANIAVYVIDSGVPEVVV